MAHNASHPDGVHARSALLPEGWCSDVDIRFDGDGLIDQIQIGVRDSDLEKVEGPLVPGMPNAHSHAFQRLLVGRTQELTGQDDFWSWRSAMYRLVNAIEPEDLSGITAWVYSEMLASGYTSVAEFHYLFNDPAGSPYADPAELPRRMATAAADTGIGLTLVPVLYCRSGFDDGPLAGGALRFRLTPDEYVRLVECLETDGQMSGMQLGVGPHSLRAVGPDDLAAILMWSRSRPPCPVHVHAAEQPAEVAACVAATGLRPVHWLLQNASPGPDWTIVHATHTTEAERQGLAETGTGIAVCPTTEADLGDGVFPLSRWLKSGGRFGVGSDSNAHFSPVEELRLPVYTARLMEGRRGALPLDPARPVGSQMWQLAARDGAAALGQPVGILDRGYRADFLVLDPERPELQGLTPDRILDAFVMSGDRTSIARTVVAGRVMARNGRHVEAEQHAAAGRVSARAVAERLRGS